MATLQYDKGKANDNLSFGFLTDAKNYKPLNQKFRLYLKPLYAKDGEWQKTRTSTYFKRLLFGLLLIKAGIEFGKWDSKDPKLARSTVVNFESEDQIFDYLYNKNKRAVLLHLYTPGHMINENFMREFERASGQYSDKGDDEIVFMKVLCRKHLNFCTNKMWPGRILPAAEVYYLNEQDKIELVDFGELHRSQAGIEAFFVQNGLLEDKFDPSALLERAGRKYLDII